MEYLRKVDFAAFAPDRFSWQVLAETERCIIVIVRQPANDKGPRRAPHYHLADQVFYMLEGGLDIELDGVKHHAERDSTIFIPAGTVHSHAASEDELHLDIISPAPTRGMPLGRYVDQSYPDLPDNPHSPAIRVEPGKPRTLAWVKSAAEAPVHPTRMPGFDVRPLVNRAVGSEHIFINGAVVQPGPGPAWHIHDFDQFYYVQEGVLTVEIANKRYEVHPHQLMVVPAGVPHRNWNNGTVTERHLAIMQPQPPEGAPMEFDVKFEMCRSAA